MTYDTRPNSDTNTQRELVLEGYRNSRNVLCGISNDGKKDQSNPFLTNYASVRDSIDAVYKKLSSDRDELQLLYQEPIV